MFNTGNDKMVRVVLVRIRVLTSKIYALPINFELDSSPERHVPVFVKKKKLVVIIILFFCHM